jgi:GNAT superfamily N-acetyltransferase
MRIIRVTAQNVWRLQQIERTVEPSTWVGEAEEFLFDGRAMRLLRNEGTIMLAVDDGLFVGAGIAYPDPSFQTTSRLGAMSVDHRHRRAGVGRQLFEALLTEALRAEPYVIWLVHQENVAMLALARGHALVVAEALTADGYVQFFAERRVH